MSNPTNPSPAPADPVQAFFASVNAKVGAFVAGVNTDAAVGIRYMKAALGWADQELPKVEETLNVVMSVLAVFFPQAAAAESFLTAISDGVAIAERTVKTVNRLMTLNPGQPAPAGSSPLGGAAKNTVMNQVVNDAGFAHVPDSVVNLFAEPHVALLNARQAQAKTAPGVAPSRPA